MVHGLKFTMWLCYVHCTWGIVFEGSCIYKFQELKMQTLKVGVCIIKPVLPLNIVFFSFVDLLPVNFVLLTRVWYNLTSYNGCRECDVPMKRGCM